jgi:hypothetical protein
LFGNFPAVLFGDFGGGEVFLLTVGLSFSPGFSTIGHLKSLISFLVLYLF